MTRTLLEVCCASADFAVAAGAAGADRIELCSNLVEGGTTPSAGAVRLAVARAGVPVMAMVRPRGGDFVYSETEADVMLADIDVFADAGVAGVVFGALDIDGRVDRDCVARLLDAARPLPVTFHRAFDLSRDLDESLDTLIELGVDRVLTSVGHPSVLEALDRLASLIERSGRDITVVPCGGIRPDNIQRVLDVGGVREVHIGASTRRQSPMRYRRSGVSMGVAYRPDEYSVEAADTERIAGVAGGIASWSGGPGHE